MTGPRPMAADSVSRWIASLVLAVSCGISAGLLSGEPAIGFALAGLLAVILTLVVMLSPAAGRGRQPRELYFYAILVLLGPWILLKVGYRGRGSARRPLGWDDLQDRFVARGAAPSGLVSVGEVVVNRKTSMFTVQPYSYKRVTATLGDSEVHLALSFPWSWIYEPAALRIASIRQCRASTATNGDFATLTLSDATFEIDVADPERDVLKWCQRHEIPDGSS